MFNNAPRRGTSPSNQSKILLCHLRSFLIFQSECFRGSLLWKWEHLWLLGWSVRSLLKSCIQNMVNKGICLHQEVAAVVPVFTWVLFSNSWGLTEEWEHLVATLSPKADYAAARHQPPPMVTFQTGISKTAPWLKGNYSIIKTPDLISAGPFFTEIISATKFYWKAVFILLFSLPFSWSSLFSLKRE